MKRTIWFGVVALLLTLTIPSYAGQARRGWTKVHLTYGDGGVRPFPPELLKAAGGELLADYTHHALGYVPHGGLAGLKSEAAKRGIAVEVRDDFDVLRLPSSARVDVREGIGDAVPPSDRFREYPPRKPGLFLIQFIGPARAEWISELVSMGWRMARYIPANGYIVAGVPELAGRTRQLPYIQFVDFFHPYQKAKQLVRDGVARDLMFELSSAADPADAIEAIRGAAGGEVQVFRGNSDTLVFARLGHAGAEPLLHHPLIISVSPRPVGALSDERQAVSLTSNVNSAGSQPTATGYTTWLSGRCAACATMSAATWRIGLADTGLDDGTAANGHPDLAGRKYFGARLYSTTGHDTCTAGNLNCDDYTHGTIVAGIMAGNAATGLKDDANYFWGMGIAPAAGIFSTKVMTATGKAIDFTRLFEFTRDATQNGVTIQNHSFNEYPTVPNQSGLYSALARQYDIAVRDSDDALSGARTPLLIAVSAGNTDQGAQDEYRFRVLGGGTAKNVISVGGSENYRPEVAGCLASGNDFRNVMKTSRTGTRLAGYIKPDLVAAAAPVGSTNTSESLTDNSYCIDDLAQFEPDDNGVENRQYNGDSGTSFAAPVAAASSLLVKRYLGSSPSATSPALAKAMLVAGAKSIAGGIDKTTTPNTAVAAFPNGQQGFGRISLDDIITGSTPPLWYDQSSSRTFGMNAAPYRIRLRVRDASKPVKVALVWTDAPATAYVEVPLVNDLDLEVFPTTIGAMKYVGNYLQITDPNKGEESKAVWYADGVEGRDRTNNVEVIRAFMTASEEFDVQVSAPYIWGDTDGDPNTFEQDFALVVLNADKVNSGNPVAPVIGAQRDGSDTRKVNLWWTAAANLMNLEYQVWRGTNVSNMQLVGTTPYDQWADHNLAADTSYVYKVVATGSGGASATSNLAVGTTISWWPHEQVQSSWTPIAAEQWNDLRRGTDYVRTAAGLATGAWSGTIASSGFITAAQANEIRTKLLEAFAALGVTAPTFTTPSPTAGVTFITRTDVVELRAHIE